MSPSTHKQTAPRGEQELKFLVPVMRSPALRDWLDAAFTPHPRYAASTICSIYFDTPDLLSLAEKNGSYFSKTKIRIRWYADRRGRVLDVPAFIEAKEKHGASRLKHRMMLPVAPQELADTPLDSPFFDRLLHEHGPMCPALARGVFRPVMELRYVRYRYEHRVFDAAFCLDTDIRCQRAHPGVIPATSALPLPHDVFEQKGRHAEPLPVLRPLARFDVRRSSFSKYHLTFSQHLHETALP